MALEVDTLVSTGATLAVGAGVVFDGVAIGASTGKMEVIKLADGTPGSSVMVAASSNGIGAVGLNTFVVNSTANPVGVSIAAGQSTVTGSGVFHIDDNAASITIDFNNAAISSANPLPMQLVSTTATPGPVMISSAAPASTDLGLAVRQIGFVAYSTNVTVAGSVTANIAGNSTAIISSASIIKVDTIGAFPANSSNVVISGNSTAIISSASIIKIDTIGAFPANSSLVVINAAIPQSSVTLSTAGAGGSSANMLWVQTAPQVGGGNSTYSNPAKITSTALTTLFSSGASTRFNLTDIQITNKGATISLVRVFDTSTSGTLMFQAECATAGGGIATTFGVPRVNTAGAPIVVKSGASTVYVSAGAFKSA